MAPVLVVDDDREIRETLRCVLEDAGYEVIEAVDGMQALAVMEAALEPLNVLLDLMMPRLDGAGVLQRLSERPDLAARHACVLMSASRGTHKPAVTRLRTALGIPLVQKPFDIDDLLAILAASEAMHRRPSRSFPLPDSAAASAASV
jgi:CheY-like chemotaxis protein